MKSFLIIGLGSFGHHLCHALAQQRCEIMAVDKSGEALEDVLPYVVSAKVGDCTNVDVLRSFSVDNFDVCFVCLGSNVLSSLQITSLLKELGAKRVFSKADDDTHAKFLLRNGADEVVYPERQMAVWTAIRYSSDHISDYIALGDDHAIFEVMVPDQWVGKTIGQLDVRKRYNVNIMAIKQNGRFSMTVITPDTCLPSNSTILVLGTHRDIQKCFHI